MTLCYRNRLQTTVCSGTEAGLRPGGERVKKKKNSLHDLCAEDLDRATHAAHEQYEKNLKGDVASMHTHYREKEQKNPFGKEIAF